MLYICILLHIIIIYIYYITYIICITCIIIYIYIYYILYICIYISYYKRIIKHHISYFFCGLLEILIRLVSPDLPQGTHPGSSGASDDDATGRASGGQPGLFRMWVDPGGSGSWSLDIPGLVNIQKAIEKGHRNSEFSH